MASVGLNRCRNPPFPSRHRLLKTNMEHIHGITCPVSFFVLSSPTIPIMHHKMKRYLSHHFLFPFEIVKKFLSNANGIPLIALNVKGGVVAGLVVHSFRSQKSLWVQLSDFFSLARNLKINSESFSKKKSLFFFWKRKGLNQNNILICSAE